MKLDIKAVAIAEGLVVAAVFVLCAFVIAVVPEQTAAATKYLFHIDLSRVARPISWRGFFSGLVVSSVAMGLAGAVWASIYNPSPDRCAGTNDLHGYPQRRERRAGSSDREHQRRRMFDESDAEHPSAE